MIINKYKIILVAFPSIYVTEHRYYSECHIQQDERITPKD